MVSAKRALASAKLLYSDDDFDGTVNRRHAMFTAAHAMLYLTDVSINPATIKTHNGLITAFGLHVVKLGIMPNEFGKLLNQVERLRLIADYTSDTIEKDQAQWVVTQAEAFVAAINTKFTEAD
jgi:uncharacterized protein (UPF0332 family)